MDWRNYKFWRRNIPRVDETTAEFDLLVQRTIGTITLGNQIRRCFQLLQGSSTGSKKVPEREDFT
jgi:hypothetical protein